jgi:tetratricopeptide (TPR) repeat protein
MARERRFAWQLAALCAVAAAVRALLLREYLAENPFAWLPYSDGELYWSRAGEMAAGSWLPDTPFLIAPLYPYLLGALRWLGGGLVALYAVQLALHLATGVLVGAAARIRFGERVGLVGAGLFLLLAEPALFATRVLSPTLQLLLVALLWWDWARLAEAPGYSPRHALRVAAWLGLLALAFPAALLLGPVYAGWLAARAPSPREALLRAALGAGATLLVIAPATLHNATRSGALIPITAHAGITLAQGNDPASIGIYTPLAGLSRSIHRQHLDAARIYEQEVGRPGSWSEVDAHFRHRVVGWWRAHPGEAAALLAAKLRWVASARRYDNVAVFALEREQGLWGRAWLVPVEVPWLLGAGLLGLAVAWRRPIRPVPELALLALPLLVCLVFYYSARYRLVGAPVLCGLAALALVRGAELPGSRALRLAVALLPLPLLAWNAATGFEDLDFMREPHRRTLARHHLRAGEAREAAADLDTAERHYRRAARVDAAGLEATRRLYNLQATRADYPGAVATLQDLAARDPADVPTRLALAWLLGSCPDQALRDGDAARRHAREALRLTGGAEPEALLVLALAEAERGRFDAALEAVARARSLASERDDPFLVRNLESLATELARERSVHSPPRMLRVAAHPG